MIVQHIIEDLDSVFSDHPEAEDYSVGFASYLEDGSGQINLKDVEAFHWDEDNEFFLVPEGASKLYELEATVYTGKSFLTDLLALDENIKDFAAFARDRTKTLKDGSVASVNSPLWGTGYHDEAKIIYFYHGKQPE